MSFYVFTLITALIGAFVSMVIGFVWYGPIFGKQWMEIMGISKENMKNVSQKEMIPHYALNFLVAFVQF